MYDLDVKKGAGSSKERAAAEQAVLTAIIATLDLGAATYSSTRVREIIRPDLQRTQFCVTPPVSPRTLQCVTCVEVRQSPTLLLKLVISAFGAAAPCRAQVAPACPAPGNHMYSKPEEQQSFPTEQKIAQRLRAQQLKAAGSDNAPSLPKQRRKPVEQHHDDCGEDLSSLGPVETTYLHMPDSEGSSSDDDVVLSMVRPQLNAATTWSFVSSESTEPPELHPAAMLAVDLPELIALLNEPQYASWSVEIVQLCGGEALTSYLCVKRRLRSGHNFELITGTNLCDK